MELQRAGLSVRLPKEGQGHTRASQLPVDVNIIRLHIPAGVLVLVREQELLQLLVRDIWGKGPVYVFDICCRKDISDGVMRTSDACRDSVLIVVGMTQSENLTVVYFAHVCRPPDG